MLGLQTAHSPNAHAITTAYSVALVVAAVLVAAINVALLVAVLRFRARRGREASRFRGGWRTEVRVAVPLAALAIGLFVFGVIYTNKARDVPSGPELTINAVGQQWIWRYDYPAPGSTSAAIPTSTSGSSISAAGSTPSLSVPQQTFSNPFSYYELVVPVDTTVRLNLVSTDVVHRWWVPELGGKFDAVPNENNSTWFRADKEGVYTGQSAAYSGPSYAVERIEVNVVSQPAYQAWLTQQAANIKTAQTAVQQQLATTGGPPGQPPISTPQTPVPPSTAAPSTGAGGTQ